MYKQPKILLFLLLFTTNNFAQEKEYIVSNENDTIYGKVKRSTDPIFPGRTCFKIKTEDGQKVKVKPSEFKYVSTIDGLDGESFFVSWADKFFLKRIIDGKIKVYLDLQISMYFTSKEGSSISLTDFGGIVSRKKPYSQARELIKDNPQVLKEFDSLSGRLKNILYIIKIYNEAEAEAEN